MESKCSGLNVVEFFAKCPPCDHQNPQGQAPAILSLAKNARRPLSRVLAANAPPLEELLPLQQQLLPQRILCRPFVPSALSTIEANSLVALRKVLGIGNVGIPATQKLTRGPRVNWPANVRSGFVH